MTQDQLNDSGSVYFYYSCSGFHYGGTSTPSLRRGQRQTTVTKYFLEWRFFTKRGPGVVKKIKVLILQSLFLLLLLSFRSVHFVIKILILLFLVQLSIFLFDFQLYLGGFLFSREVFCTLRPTKVAKNSTVVRTEKKSNDFFRHVNVTYERPVYGNSAE